MIGLRPLHGQLHDNTADVIRTMHENQEPFVLTRHGRLLALVTPLPDGIEGQIAAEYLKDKCTTCMHPKHVGRCAPYITSKAGVDHA